MSWQKAKTLIAHAFAYDDGRAGITDDDIAMLDQVADWVVRRQMAMPAMLMLEGSAPLNFVGSSLLTFFRPVVGLAFSTVQWERFEALLEKRCSLHLLAERIERRAAEAEAARRSEKGATPRPDAREQENLHGKHDG
jgi:hypothetical protein